MVSSFLWTSTRRNDKFLIKLLMDKNVLLNGIYSCNYHNCCFRPFDPLLDDHVVSKLIHATNLKEECHAEYPFVSKKLSFSYGRNNHIKGLLIARLAL